MAELLKVTDLKTYFNTEGGVVKAVDGISYHLDEEEKRERIILKGEVPTPLNPPSGCSFHPRCFMAVPACSQAVPPLRNVGGVHEVACIRV